MIRVSVPYGGKKAWCEIPEKNFAGYFDPEFTEPVKDLRATLNHALDNPIGSRKLEEIIGKGKTVAVIIDDSSRPTRNQRYFRLFSNELKRQVSLAKT
jgi:nickel-dependent lactate racemase